MKRERWFLWCIIIILGGLLIYNTWYGSALNKTDLVPPGDTVQSVPVSRIKSEDLEIQKTYLGKVEAIDSVEVHPYLSGFIDKIFVKGGQSVHADDLMFVLQQDEYQANRDQALAQVEQAQANLENAAAYLKRVQKTESKAISKTERDKAKADFLSAEASVKVAQAMLKSADVSYRYTEIKAPIEGVIGDVSVTLGDYVSPMSKPLVRIVRYDPIKVVFSIPYKEYLEINQSLFQGWKMQLGLGNGQIYSEDGKILFADNQVGSDTASVRLYAHFKNLRRMLLPDAYVTVLMKKKVKGMLIDKGWVHFSPEGSYIYVLQDGVISKKFVHPTGIVKNAFILTQNILDQYLVITSSIQPEQVGQKAIPMWITSKQAQSFLKKNGQAAQNVIKTTSMNQGKNAMHDDSLMDSVANKGES